MPTDLPPLSRSDLATMRLPDLSRPIAMTVSQARALFHISEEEALRLEHGLRYFAETACPECGIELVMLKEPTP
jgi:hypothetical protein